jgi:hypothetical protein
MTLAGFPHSGITGSQPACGSPMLFAAYHALLRLSVPRHPPCALVRLTGKSRNRPQHQQTACLFLDRLARRCRVQTRTPRSPLLGPLDPHDSPSASIGFASLPHPIRTHKFTHTRRTTRSEALASSPGALPRPFTQPSTQIVKSTSTARSPRSLERYPGVNICQPWTGKASDFGTYRLSGGNSGVGGVFRAWSY